jgi:ribonucleoside-triphosphate reductase
LILISAKSVPLSPKAIDAVGKQYHQTIIDLIALHVTADFESKIQDDKISVEAIQDSVETVLSESVMRMLQRLISFTAARERRSAMLIPRFSIIRNRDNYLKINDWRVKENATVTYSVGGLIFQTQAPSPQIIAFRSL